MTRFGLALIGAVLVTLTLTATANAGFTHLSEGTFCEPTGLGTPPCEPTFTQSYSLAVHEPGGELVVLDANAQTIRRFKANGEPDPFSALGGNTIDGQGSGPALCTAPSPECDGTPENGFTFANGGQEAQVAVDSSGTATDGNIYVTQKNASGLHLVDVFDSSGKFAGQLTGIASGLFGANSRPAGVAVDSDGVVFVSDFLEDKIYEYVPSGQPPVNADGSLFSTAVDNVGRIAAGAGPSDGALFASMRSSGPVFKLGSDGAIQCKVRNGEIAAVAISPGDGHVLISDSKNGQKEIAEYDTSICTENSALTPVTRFDGERTDIAVEETGGRVYATAGKQVEVFGPLVPLAGATTGETTNIGETTASVHGTVEPLGEELTECKFEYGTTTAYGSSKPCAESLAAIGKTGIPSVHADLTGLAPETIHHYRLVVANANGPGEPQGKDAAFQTTSLPELIGVWSEDVSLTEATLKAQINPQSAATSYRFEWGLDEGPPYEHVGAEASIGAGAVPKIVALPLSGLTPGTDYHYRLIATNECHPESAPATTCTSESEDLSFTTYLPVSPDTACPNQALRSEASAFPPDCRAYEMVSPVDKNGGDIVRGSIQPGVPDGYTQAALDGESITYSSLSAFGELESGGNFNQYLAARGAGDWSNSGIRPVVAGRRVTGGSVALDAFRQFMAFTPDLCYGWLIDYQTPLITEDAIDGYANLYRRDNCEPGEGDLETLTDVEPPAPADPSYVDRNSVGGISADGRHALFLAKAKLTPEASAGGIANLYDRFEGQIRLVSVGLNGLASAAGGFLGAGSISRSWQVNLATAVSEDGERVYWNNQTRLFLRLNPEQPQSALAPGNKCTEPAKACTIAVATGGQFWAASADGAKAIYTQDSLDNSEAKLFEFDLARLEAGKTASLPVAEEVEGVAGASSDASHVYFVSRKALATAPNSEGEEPSEGAPNLYLQDASGEGGPSYAFVGMLSEKDVGGKEGDAVIPYDVVEANPFYRATRVSPDGETIAFNSRAPLTGYDNTETESGKAAVEVFIYSAASEELSCASCNPSGARPQVRAQLKVAYQFPWDDERTTLVPAAAWIPTWEQPTYASRPLSDSGNRLFFNSYDALLPRDSNGEMDVYEWEAPGEGTCEESDPDYFEANGGCLYLISSGESSYESEFWEASADGGDVFFTTESSLVPPDPGSIDLYDARAGGGFTYPQAPASCEGEACQSPPAPPNDPTPASSSFEGAGNVVEPMSVRKCPKGKRRVNRKGKVRCAKRGPAKTNGKRHRRASASWGAVK